MHEVDELFGLGKKPSRSDYADEFIQVNKLLRELENYREHLKTKILGFIKNNKTKTVQGELGIIHLQEGSASRLSSTLAREKLSKEVYNSLLVTSSYDSLRVSGAPKAKKYPWE